MSQRKPTQLDSWLKRQKSQASPLVKDSSPSAERTSLQGGEVLNQPETPTNSQVSTVVPKSESPLMAQEIIEKCQPSLDYKFARDENGRSFKHSWFSSFKWLHYTREMNCALCYQCVEAVKKGMKVPKGSERAFIQNGFKNWKKGPEKFKVHEKSDLHSQSAEFLIRKDRGIPVINIISQQCQNQQKEAKQALRTMISSIRYLARTGQALRGWKSDGGNLVHLLEERSEDVPFLQTWLQKRNNWLDGKIQNEILEIMAHSVQRQLVQDLKQSTFLGIIADGTTDAAGNEQFSLCLRWMNPITSEVREDFMGMYSTKDTKANTLFHAIEDVMIRLGLGFQQVRGHCFDGAPNMCGHLNGVQKLIKDVQPKSLFVHCSNHSLDLCLQEAARTCSLLCEALGLVKDVSNIILSSAKRKNIYSDIVLTPCDQDNEEKVANLLPLCPTRWCVRVKALNRFISNYERVLETVKAILDDRNAVSDDRRAALRGYKRQLKKAKTLFALKVASNIFAPCEQFAVALQKTGYTVTKAKKSAQYLSDTLSNMRSDENFECIWRETKEFADMLDLELPQPSRERKIPRRYEYSNNSENFTSSNIDETVSLRKCFFEVVDIVTAEIEKRFHQPGMVNLLKLEEVLTDAAKGEAAKGTSLQEKLGIHASDFDVEKLEAQLVLLPSVLKTNMVSSFDICQKLVAESSLIRELMNEVFKLVELISIVPASAASAERSFSALRRVKTYLRTTMTQKRLTHVLLLNIQESYTQKINLDFIVKEFVSRTAERKCVFGI